MSPLPPCSTIKGCWEWYSNLLTGLFFSTLAPTVLPPHRRQIRPHSKSDYIRACVCVFSPVQLFVTLWTVARQAPLSKGVPRREYWRGCRFLLQGNLPNPRSNPHLLHLLHCRWSLYQQSYQGSPGIFIFIYYSM